MKMTVLKLLIPTMALLLSACASLPPELGNPDDKSVVTQYSAWLERDPATQSPVRMGGVVANISNQKDRTRVELVNLRLIAQGVPISIKSHKVALSLTCRDSWTQSLMGRSLAHALWYDSAI